MISEDGKEQLDINLVLGMYKTKLAELMEQIVLLEARVMARDQEIQRMKEGRPQNRELSEIPHR